MWTQPIHLRDGSTIAIIGAGPAGSFFADFALELARKKGMDVSITLFDSKDFTKSGRDGCNMCAGVISEPLVRRLESRGMPLPESRIQQRIAAYCLQTRTHTLTLRHPREAPRIYTVYRGNGPSFAVQNGNASFDDHVLCHAMKAGAHVIHQPVRGICSPSHPNGRIRLTYGTKEAPSTFEADLVVGAFGLDRIMMHQMERLGFGYHPPQIRRTCQAEFEVEDPYVRTWLGDRILVLSLGIEGIQFATIIPKSSCITVGLVGDRDLIQEDLFRFLQDERVHRWLPPDWEMPKRFCFCSPRLVLRSARQPFTDRVVMIGDAGFSRYCKNGIDSAFITAKLAAETAFRWGISKSAFERGYGAPARRTIIRDNWYGRVLFRVHDVLSREDLLAEAYVWTACAPQDRGGRLFRSVLWDMFTGDAPYRTILFSALRPSIVMRFFANMLRGFRERHRGSALSVGTPLDLPRYI